ncbi:MAG: hypothetical protein MJY75_03910 [Bacteroidaceae bacterium]|nr:hypothetical protein [Bacteroidaceae bacterium]
MKKLTLLILPLLAGTLFSCNRDDEGLTPVVILFENELATTARSGERIPFDVYTFTSGDNSISRILVRSYDPEYGYDTLYADYAPAQHKVRYSVEYVPKEYTADSVLVDVQFMSYDQNDRKFQVSRKIMVYTVYHKLENHSTYQLHAYDGTSANGFCLSDLNRLYNSDEQDSLDVYLKNSTGETGEVSMLTNAADVDFLRDNSFDFSNATSRSVNDNYNNHERLSKVTEIKPGDCIFVGYRRKAWGVFKCTAADGASGLFTFDYKLVPND